MQGISVVRALHGEPSFEETLHGHLNRLQKPFCMLFCIQQWLQLVLDCIVAVITVVLVSIVTFFKVPS